jgi:hypothetical protein
MNFRNGINTKVFEYSDNDGVTQKLQLKPLKGDDLQALFKVMANLQTATDLDGKTDNIKVLSLLGGETGGLLHYLCVKTLKLSYTEADTEELELFVSSHLIELFPIVIEINTPRK